MNRLLTYVTRPSRRTRVVVSMVLVVISIAVIVVGQVALSRRARTRERQKLRTPEERQLIREALAEKLIASRKQAEEGAIKESGVPCADTDSNSVLQSNDES